MLHTLVLSLAVVILNSFDISLQADSPSKREKLPVHRRNKPSSSERSRSANQTELSSQDETLSMDGSIPGVSPTRSTYFPNMYSPPVRSRSRSPTVRHFAFDKPTSSSAPRPTRCMNPPEWLPSDKGPAHNLDQLPFIRLLPKMALHRKLELRRYTFPADGKLKLRAGRNRYDPMPINEIIVVSKFNHAFAILEAYNYLAGMYFYDTHIKDTRRAKINMEDSTVSLMTTEEIADIPVGPHLRIKKHFVIRLEKPESV